MAIAFLCKPPALIFPALLAAYIFLFEEDGAAASWRRVIARCLPSLLLTAFFLILQSRLTPKTFSPGYVSASRYLLTQPYVCFR